ncbi:hypothetical protein RUM44_001053 [Polyplax serrata]|uniref:Prokineticin domain-containing protein n=1 Tax=Polyplax serrata TaxID=468196 RepID=A0ABR1B9E0_POLSC
MRGEVLKSLIVFLVSVAAVLLTVESRPRYIECSHSMECGLGSCCVLGKGRYSLPRCVSLGKLNEKCRPGSIPQNITVSYPDGESVNLSHVYSILCPCQEGLYCSDQSGVCIDQMEELVFNTI